MTLGIVTRRLREPPILGTGTELRDRHNTATGNEADGITRRERLTVEGDTVTVRDNRTNNVSFLC